MSALGSWIMTALHATRGVQTEETFPLGMILGLGEPYLLRALVLGNASAYIVSCALCTLIICISISREVTAAATRKCSRI
jgi:hypothetical protein